MSNVSQMKQTFHLSRFTLALTFYKKTLKTLKNPSKQMIFFYETTSNCKYSRIIIKKVKRGKVMRINGGIRYMERGIDLSIRAMQVQTELMSIANENVNGFDKIGYQRQEAVVSSFTEILGTNGISKTTDTKVGRISMSSNPLDFAIAKEGYFQTEGDDGIKLTRDGRFKIDKDGNLLTLEDRRVLSNSGMPIKLPLIPEKIEDIKVDDSGLVKVLNKETAKMEIAGCIGVVDANGILVMDPQVKQGYNEYSNVSLQNEFIGMMPVIRNFEANRQLFMIQNQNLQKVISQLGSTS